jgi:hypothetical protein
MTGPDLPQPVSADDPHPVSDPAPQAFGPLVGPLFWIVIALSVACIAAGALVGLAGPKLFPVRAASHRIGSWQAVPRPLNSAA